MVRIGAVVVTVLVAFYAFSPGGLTTGYRDGTYRGDSRQSVYGRARLNVTIKDGRITDIEFLEIPDWYPERVSEEMEAAIIERQSSRVDAVSGATLSSELIVEAVAAALEKASGPVRDDEGTRLEEGHTIGQPEKN